MVLPFLIYLFLFHLLLNSLRGEMFCSCFLKRQSVLFNMKQQWMQMLCNQPLKALLLQCKNIAFTHQYQCYCKTERKRVSGEEKRKRTYLLPLCCVKNKSFIIFILEFVSYFKSKCTSCVAIFGVLNINTLRQVSKTYIESRAASCCKSTSNHWRKIKSICITNTVTQF